MRNNQVSVSPQGHSQCLCWGPERAGGRRERLSRRPAQCCRPNDVRNVCHCAVRCSGCAQGGIWAPQQQSIAGLAVILGPSCRAQGHSAPKFLGTERELRGLCLNSFKGRHLDRGAPCTCHGLVSSPEDSRFIRRDCSPAKPLNSAKKHLSFKPQRTSSLPSQARKISSLSLKPWFGSTTFPK